MNTDKTLRMNKINFALWLFLLYCLLKVSESACTNGSMTGCLTCDASGSPCTVCDQANDYYLTSPNCILCNTGQYFNKTQSICLPCTDIPHCQTCETNGKCTQCLTDYWIDFSTDNKTCSSCLLYKCKTCDHGPVCTSCQKGYFVHPVYKICFQCQFPCGQCDVAADNCTKCPSSKLYYHDPGTMTCILCSPQLSNCLKCNELGDACEQCVSDYFYVDPVSNLCVGCPAPCKQCLSQTVCLSCLADDHVLVPTTQKCQTCVSQIPRCLTCLSETVCMTCDTVGGPFYLTYPPKNCVTCQEAHQKCINCQAVPGYGPGCIQCVSDHFLENHLCHSCPQTCLTCNNYTDCTSCINTKYVINNGMCVLCNQVVDNCVLCSFPNVCNYCTNSTIAIGGKCLNCTLTQYPDEINQLCQPCVSPCYSCLNADDCLTCDTFYEFVPAIKRCHDLCGDSVVMTDQCDNSFNVLHDGCTDTCQEESDYTCVLHPDTVSGQSVHRSVCSYDLKVNITLKHIEKEPFKNTLTWTYVVVPFLYGLPGTTLRDYTQEELIKTFVLYDINQGPPVTLTSLKSSSIDKVNHQVSKVVSSSSPFLTVESVSVNPIKSEVSVTFSHQQQITESDIRLMVNFTYLRSSLGIPNFSTTPDSDKVVKVSSYRPQSMIGKFYTDQEYSLASTLNKVALLIGILSFVAFVIGLCSKELVGLQMAMLTQFAYLSLFYFDGTLELPLFALKSLVYSTGYNLQSWSDKTTYTLTDNNPPQSLTLDFDTMTFSHNFNLMALLYVLPLIAVIPFIPMKAKCIRKLSIIELGHKWVDLLLGEIMLYIVLFNLQYFLFGVIVFYQDGRNVKEYLSSMIVSFGCLMTLMSVFGLILKPQIYANFRTSFEYDKELRSEVIQSKPKMKQNACKKMIQRFNLFVNESYFWKNYRTFHSVLTFNHYFILSFYFIISIMLMALLQNSAIVNLALSGIVLFEVILMRPYHKVSQKLRAIYFYIVFTVISFVRYAHNTLLKGQYNLILSIVLVGLLAVALIWTLIVLIHYFYVYFTEQFSDRKGMVQKIFKVETDIIDIEKINQQEEALMRKLMKKYERVELQFNFNNARSQLLSGYDSLTMDKPLQNTSLITKPIDEETKIKQKFIDDQVLKKMQEENNFANLKQQISKHKNKIKKQEMKKKVTGQKLLKLLSLDNFNKYEQKFLIPEQKKLQNYEYSQEINEPNIFGNNYERAQQKQKKHSVQITQQYQSVQQQSQDSKMNGGNEKESMQSEDESSKRQDEEKLFIEQNQFMRYTRAKNIISNQGLTIDFDLIANNFDKI